MYEFITRPRFNVQDEPVAGLASFHQFKGFLIRMSNMFACFCPFASNELSGQLQVTRRISKKDQKISEGLQDCKAVVFLFLYVFILSLEILGVPDVSPVTFRTPPRRSVWNPGRSGSGRLRDIRGSWRSPGNWYLQLVWYSVLGESKMGGGAASSENCVIFVLPKIAEDGSPRVFGPFESLDIGCENAAVLWHRYWDNGTHCEGPVVKRLRPRKWSITPWVQFDRPGKALTSTDFNVKCDRFNQSSTTTIQLFSSTLLLISEVWPLFSDFIWFYMGFHMVLYGSIWFCMVLYGFMPSNTSHEYTWVVPSPGHGAKSQSASRRARGGPSGHGHAAWCKRQGIGQWPSNHGEHRKWMDMMENSSTDFGWFLDRNGYLGFFGKNRFWLTAYGYDNMLL